MKPKMRIKFVLPKAQRTSTNTLESHLKDTAILNCSFVDMAGIKKPK